jgi:hypothetical protein
MYAILEQNCYKLLPATVEWLKHCPRISTFSLLPLLFKGAPLKFFHISVLDSPSCGPPRFYKRGAVDRTTHLTLKKAHLLVPPEECVYPFSLCPNSWQNLQTWTAAETSVFVFWSATEQITVNGHQHVLGSRGFNTLTSKPCAIMGNSCWDAWELHLDRRISPWPKIGRLEYSYEQGHYLFAEERTRYVPCHVYINNKYIT